MSVGMLTQVINNLSRTSETIQKFSGLNANAIPIQRNIKSAINALLPDIKKMQHDVTTWGLKLEAQLDKKLAVLESLTPSELALFISQSKEEITKAMSQVDKVKDRTKNTDNIVVENNIALQRMIIDLQATIAGLKSNLQGNQQKLDELNKKKLNFIALGILGIPGIIAMAVMVSKTQSTVNRIGSQIAAQQSDIRQQQSFATQTFAFSQDLLDLSNHMLKIGNAIEFIRNDIQNVDKNISGSEATQLMKLFFTATKMNVKTLLVDVS